MSDGTGSSGLSMPHAAGGRWGTCHGPVRSYVVLDFALRWLNQRGAGWRCAPAQNAVARGRAMTITFQLRVLISEWLLQLAYPVMPAGLEKGALEKALNQYDSDLEAAAAFAAKLP